MPGELLSLAQHYHLTSFVYLHRYGLGTCYLRMSKIRLAEFHYRRAAEIHPNNTVLLGCVGMVGCVASIR
jgi:hypothetical protein